MIYKTGYDFERNFYALKKYKLRKDAKSKEHIPKDVYRELKAY